MTVALLSLRDGTVLEADELARQGDWLDVTGRRRIPRGLHHERDYAYGPRRRQTYTSKDVLRIDWFDAEEMAA